MLENYEWYSKGVMTLIMVTFSVVMTFVHRIQVHVPKSAVCTAINTPADCYTKGGYYRAVNFISQTTSTSFVPLTGTVYSPGGVLRPVTDAAFPMNYATNAFNHTQAFCNAKFAAEPVKAAACRAEKLQDIWEVPNAALSRQLWTLAGGIHIWYFLWLSQWIGTSFTLVMLPAEVNGYREIALALWHFLGIVLTVVFFVNDRDFSMRLPFNNMVLGVIFQGAAAVVQSLWVLNTFEWAEWHTNPNTMNIRYSHAKNHTVHATGSQYQKLPQSLTSLMTLGNKDEEAMMVKSDLPVGKPVAASEVELDSVSVYDVKYFMNELIEALFTEAAFSLPPAMLAAYCIGARVNPDWVVSAVLFRAFFMFVVIAMVFKVIAILMHDITLKQKPDAEKGRWDWVPKHTELTAKLEGNPSYALLVVIALGVVVWVGVQYFIELYSELRFTVFATTTLSNGASPAFVIFLLITLCVLLFVAICDIYVLLSDAIVTHHQIYVWYGLQLLLFLFRVFAFSFAVQPALWYKHYDRRDVVMGYPSYIHT